MTNSASGLTFSGTTSQLSSGFTKLAVTASSDATLIGKSGYAYEVPGVALTVQPPTSGVSSSAVRLIVMVAHAAGTNWVVGTEFNWVVIPSSLWHTGYNDGSGSPFDDLDTSYQSNASGHGKVKTILGTAITITIDEFDMKGTLTGTGDNALVDQGSGKMTGSSGTVNFTFQVSPAGAFMGDNTDTTGAGLSSAGFFGMTAPASAIVKSDIVGVAREFRGFTFRNQTPTSNPVLGRTTNGGTTILGGQYSDMDAGTEDFSMAVTVDLGTQGNNGVFLGTITETGGPAQPAYFMVNQIGGKYFIFGIKAKAYNDPVNFLLLEQ